jgi:2-C-methyl-D-erythritol 4-phosphate cytidylyltransferase
MYGDKRIAVIIAAAGSGTRMGSGISKQYIKIGDDMILEKALKAFSDHPCVDDIYLVVKKRGHGVLPERVCRQKTNT